MFDQTDDEHVRDPGLLLLFARWLKGQVEKQNMGKYCRGDLFKIELGAQFLEGAARRIRERVNEECALRDGRKMLNSAKKDSSDPSTATKEP
jgi:hypothetical protein